MENFFTKLQREGRALRMSAEEKQRVRIRLYETMSSSPARAAHEEAPRLARVISPYRFFPVRWAGPVAALLILGLGSGTAFAAQGSLPGDALYPIKVNVNEAVETALATTPQAKAELHAALAETRLKEAEELAAQGRLTASTSQELAANFDSHASQAQDLSQSFAATDPASAAQISAEFDSTLQAHDAILASLAGTSTSSGTSTSAAPLAIALRKHERVRGIETEGSSTTAVAVAAFSGPRAIRSFSSATSTSTGTASSSSYEEASSAPQGSQGLSAQDDEAVALAMETHASSTFAAAQSNFNGLQGSLGTTLSADITVELAAIQDLMNQGASAQSTGDYRAEAQFYTSALRMAVRLGDYLQAGIQNPSLLPSLFNIPQGAQKGGKGTTHDRTSRQNQTSGQGSSTEGSSTVQNVELFQVTEQAGSGSDAQTNIETNISGENQTHVDIGLH